MKKWKDLPARKSKRWSAQYRGEPNGVYLVRQADGSYAKQRTESPRKKRTFADIESLVSFVSDVGRDGAYYIALDGVEHGAAHRGKDHEVDVVRTPLTVTKAFQFFQKGVVTLSQEALVRAMRTTLYGMTGPAFLKTVQGIKWRTAEDSEGVVEQKGVSLGKSLKREATFAGDLPETVIFTVPLIEQIPTGELAGIECAVCLNFDTQQIELHPLPGRVANAEQLALTQIQSTIEGWKGEDDESPIYFGTLKDG